MFWRSIWVNLSLVVNFDIVIAGFVNQHSSIFPELSEFQVVLSLKIIFDILNSFKLRGGHASGSWMLVY